MLRKTLRTKAHRTLIAVLTASRKETGLTQREVAVRLRRPQSYLAKIESGERRLDVIEFVELARALRVNPQKLFERFLRW